MAVIYRNLRGGIGLAIRANVASCTMGSRSRVVLTRAVGKVVGGSSKVIGTVASSSSSSNWPVTTVTCSSMATSVMTCLPVMVGTCTCGSSSVTTHSRVDKLLNTFNHGSNLSSISI